MTEADFLKIAEILKNWVDDPSMRAMLGCEFAAWLRKDYASTFNEMKFFAATKRNTGRVWEYPLTGTRIVD
jgi:hypothetical protein